MALKRAFDYLPAHPVGAALIASGALGAWMAVYGTWRRAHWALSLRQAAAGLAIAGWLGARAWTDPIAAALVSWELINVAWTLRRSVRSDLGLAPAAWLRGRDGALWRASWALGLLLLVGASAVSYRQFVVEAAREENLRQQARAREVLLRRFPLLWSVLAELRQGPAGVHGVWIGAPSIRRTFSSEAELEAQVRPASEGLAQLPARTPSLAEQIAHCTVTLEPQEALRCSWPKLEAQADFDDQGFTRFHLAPE